MAEQGGDTLSYQFSRAGQGGAGQGRAEQNV